MIGFFLLVLVCIVALVVLLCVYARPSLTPTGMTGSTGSTGVFPHPPFVQIGSKISENSAAAHEGSSLALIANGTLLAAGAPSFSPHGTVYVYSLTDPTAPVLLQQIVPTGTLGTDPRFGVSVAFSDTGGVLAVGAYNDNDGVGAVFVYTTSDLVTWTLQSKLIPNNGTVNPNFGVWISLSSDGLTLAGGGPSNNSAEGAVWVWTFENGTWTQQAKLIGSPGSSGDLQGLSVSLSADGNTCAFGGPGANDSIGSVWVFVQASGVWTQQAYLPSPSVSPGDQFGTTVALNSLGNILAVGAIGVNNSTGSTFVYKLISNTWTLQASLVGTGANPDSTQGTWISLSGDGSLLVVGGPDDGAGQCWIFQWNPNTLSWVQIQGPFAGTGESTPGTGLQGSVVAFSRDGTRLVESGYGDNDFAGSVWLFQ